MLSLNYSLAVEKFKSYLLFLERSPETISGYSKDLKYFESFLKDQNPEALCDLKSISESDIESYLGCIRSRNLSKNTRNRNLYTLRSFYSFALKKDLVSINPTINIPPLSVNSGERNFLSFSDFEALVSKVEDSVARNIIHIMFYSGLRVSECLNIKSTDLDLDKRIIKVSSGKGDKYREVPICALLHGYLEKCLSIDDYYTHVFKGKISPQRLNTTLKSASKKAGLSIHVSSHTLRHSFASNLILNGASIVSVQKLLGHSDLRSTSLYMHVDKKFLEDTVNLLSSTLSSSYTSSIPRLKKGYCYTYKKIKISKELNEMVIEVAKKNNISQSEFIEIAVHEYLSKL